MIDDELYGPCKCGSGVHKEHLCPYSSELYDSDAKCHCCADCTHECCMDI